MLNCVLHARNCGSNYKFVFDEISTIWKCFNLYLYYLEVVLIPYIFSQLNYYQLFIIRLFFLIISIYLHILLIISYYFVIYLLYTACRSVFDHLKMYFFSLYLSISGAIVDLLKNIFCPYINALFIRIIGTNIYDPIWTNQQPYISGYFLLNDVANYLDRIPHFANVSLRNRP